MIPESNPVNNSPGSTSVRTERNGSEPINYDAMVDGNFFTPEEVAAEHKAKEAQEMLLQQGPHGPSDEGNAQCTRALHGGRFLYNDAFGWVHYNGRQWTLEGAEAAVDRAIVNTVTARARAAVESGELERYAKLVKFCIPNRTRIQGAKYLLQSLVVAGPGEFDTDPDMLNCRNGVVDLRTGELYPHSPEQRFTHCATANYSPDANWDTWENWLRSAVGDDAAIEWLQMAVGYTLTGHTYEEILFYLYGPPRAGKGMFTETLLALLGSPLAKEVNFGTFTAQRTGDSQNFDLAPLKPCRAVFASESNSYERFNEAKIKSLTGGNEIYCAFKHRNHFNYRPQFKIWLSSNQPVNADPDDDAVWGRIRVIEFPNSHLGKEDKRLKQRMKDPTVLEGVLAWAVAGAVKWYQLGSGGLPELESSAQAKEQQRGELDNVQAWLDEECQQDPDAFTLYKDVYKSYRWWCDDNGVTPKKQKAFTQTMERKGYKKAQRRVEGKRPRGFTGLRIREMEAST